MFDFVIEVNLLISGLSLVLTFASFILYFYADKEKDSIILMKLFMISLISFVSSSFIFVILTIFRMVFTYQFGVS